jgi:hypothetical protein
LTISGGSLAGRDVVLVEDPGKIEVGATVELKDGRPAEVVNVNGKLLSKFGVLPGDVMLKLDDGTTFSTSSHDIARIVSPPE